MEYVSLAIALVSGGVAGALVALRFIAPRTKSKKDDRVLEVLERAIPFLPDALREQVLRAVE